MAENRSTVAHEAGHAALSVLKPALGNAADAAFHEFFGDFAAIATGYDDAAAVKRILAETGGDPRRSNENTRQCEEIQHLFDTLERIPGDVVALRDVSEHVHVRDFAVTDLMHATDEKVLPEPHKLSRLLSGAIYELFAERANSAAAGASADEKVRRIQSVRDDVSALVYGGLDYMREHGNSLSDIAGAWLIAARHLDASGRAGGGFEAQLRTILDDRGMTRPGETPVPSSMRSVPALHIAANASPPQIMREPAVAAIFSTWAAQVRADIVPREDVTTSQGMRVVRYAFGAPQRSPGGERVLWAGALTFDSDGNLIAASNALN